MIAGMRTFHFPLFIGLVVGLFSGILFVGIALAFSSVIKIDQGTIATFVGTGLGAAITVLGALAIEEKRRITEEMRQVERKKALARLVITRLITVQNSLAECKNLFRSAKGQKLSTLNGDVAGVAIRARAAIGVIEQIQMEFGQTFYEIIIPADNIKSALDVSARRIEMDVKEAGSLLDQLFNRSSVIGKLEQGWEAKNLITEICQSHA
jgi:hypothetical protein